MKNKIQQNGIKSVNSFFSSSLGTNMHRTLFVILIMVSPSAMSCGSTAHYFNTYWNLDSVEKKTNRLNQIGCNDPINYAPRTADPIIAKVLVDAIEKHFPSDLIEKVLKNYNCAYGARGLPDYKVIRDFITDEKFAEFCNIERLQRIYIVQVEGGAVFRAAPATTSERLSAVAEGVFVEVEKFEGEWAKIHYEGKSGYIYKPLLSAY